ncbi:hypothetical protein ALC53_05049 [Atta colombica]|uniref:Uncharacterized protein n=1 Tax=Atta colombica TaxID=520822 RepID=A0A151I4I3_9HYME|nr:hypothetical protein ALC53_05049 [Atta colombica]
MKVHELVKATGISYGEQLIAEREPYFKEDVNKPLHVGCHIEFSREINMKRTIINVQLLDNACFAWSVIAALHLAKKNTERKSSYPHYSIMLNLTSSMFTSKTKKILPLWLTDRKRGKHVNFLFIQDPCNDNTGHFAWTKNFFRLMRSQIIATKNRIYFCDRLENLTIAQSGCPVKTTSDIKIRFINSFKFLSTNLEKLASYLDKDKLKITRSEFLNLSAEDFDLFIHKGIFPYEYVDCVEKLEDT